MLIVVLYVNRYYYELQHGAAVFLYHPCADPGEVAKLKAVARSCIRKHVITPYRHLPEDQVLARREAFAIGRWMFVSSFSQNCVDLIRSYKLDPISRGEKTNAPLIYFLFQSYSNPYGIIRLSIIRLRYNLKQLDE